MLRRRSMLLTAVLVLACAAVGAAQGPPKPRPETARLDPLTRPESTGGAPWGVRHYLTTTGLPCVEPGRRVGDQLGTVDDSGAFQPTAPGSGNWICGGAPTDPPRGFATSMTYLDRSGAKLSCSPIGPPDQGEQRCDPARVRTIVMIDAGPALASATAGHGSRARHLVIPAGGTVFLDVHAGVVQREDLRLSFRGGCDPRRRRVLLRFHAAHRAPGCRVVIPLRLGRP